MKYLSILRGINVSGQKKIKMADLKQLYEGLGFKEVQTYIQSGNVVFSNSKVAEGKLENKITAAIEKAYGFQVPIIVLLAKDFLPIQHNNPFLQKRQEDTSKLYVTVLRETPAPEFVEKLESLSYLPDEFILIDKNIFIFCPNGYGRTKLNNNFFERKLKVTASTRNWKSILALSQLLET